MTGELQAARIYLTPNVVAIIHAGAEFCVRCICEEGLTIVGLYGPGTLEAKAEAPKDAITQLDAAAASIMAVRWPRAGDLIPEAPEGGWVVLPPHVRALVEAGAGLRWICPLESYVSTHIIFGDAPHERLEASGADPIESMEKLERLAKGEYLGRKQSKN